MTDETATFAASATRATPIESLPDALADGAALRAALAGRTPVLFLDYDGTLTPICDRPKDAILSPEGREAVRALAAKLPVAVVSGRDRADVEAMVGLPDLIYAGSHGFDIRIPGQGEIALDGLGDHVTLLDQVAVMLHEGLDPIKGTLIERKKFSIAAHYRMVADDDYPAFRACLDRVKALDGVKEKTGKKIFEFQPDIDWDKGKAVLRLRTVLDLDGEDKVPMFFGDDVTDEDAFKVLPSVGGIGIVVAGPEEDGTGRLTHAHFRVTNPEAVYRLLEVMVD
ncbi:MAG: trehalose-phosphatase [Rhodospirillum sp.]|nr:trehalose-phosphatase [Rhodospirillum sp.]MCF8489418.1 trehalose-phosphatase [Rhodospirillum sp.]MCF8501643.1 trehalose-phosphatase [Rhodospirillum sp.]